MNKLFFEEENEFLSDAAVDYVSLHNIFGIIAKGFEHETPTKKEFELMTKFLKFLFNKYSTFITYTSGPGERIDKTPAELLQWLNYEYNQGNYYDLSYSIWFDLDESVIPKEYIPKPMEDNEPN